MFQVGAICLDIFSQLGSNFSIALQQVLAGHSVLTGSAARRNHVLRTGERFFHVGGEGEVHPFKTAVAHLFHHTFQALGKRVVKADIGREAHHCSRLHHVGTDHAGSSYNR